MTRRMLMSVTMALFATVSVWAHGGHTERILGTITAVHPNHLEIQTKDGKTISVVLNSKTSILKGKVKAGTEDLREGVRVVVQAAHEKDHFVATSVTLAAAATTSASASSKTPAKSSSKP